MKTQSPLIRGLFCGVAICAAAVSTGASAQKAAASAAATTSVEEVVVTGSFIKRSVGFPSASPVDVLGKEELQVRAPTNLANFFSELPYNFGSSFSTGRALGGGERGFGSVNLRGLGNAATLVLMNGHRVTQVADSPDNIVDVNSLVPDIMVERFEILKDGASALYGTDAVAGVVNVITRDNFSGLTAAARINYYDYAKKGDRSYQVLAGTDLGGKGHITAAFSYVDQDMISSTFGAPVLANDKTNLRYTIASGSVGRYVVPSRNAAGVIAGAARTIVDPECGHVLGTAPTNVPAATAIATLLPVATATDCRYFFFDDNALQSELKRYQGFLRGTYEISDNIKFTGEFGYTKFNTTTPYTVGESTSVPVIIPGTNPGNPFKAVNAAGQQLYAVSSGVAAGYSRDGAPVFLPSRDAQGRVILTATPTVAASGIPFYEDVTLNGRLLNSQCDLPTNNSIASGGCAESRASKSDDSVMATSGYFSGKIFENWDYNVGASYSDYKISTNGTTGNGLTRELNLALDGLGGPGCPIVGSTGVAPARGSATCQYFNPFGNNVFATGANAYQANTQATINWVIPALNDKYESELLVVEGRVAGSLFKLPAGDLGVAAGYQFRRARLIADYDVQRNNGNTTNLNTANDFNISRNTHAYFGEVNVPVINNDWGYAEVNGAVRYEKIGDNFDTTNPKVGVLYKTPGQKVVLRGSYGKSFVAPSLFRLFGNVGAGTAVNDCPVAQLPGVCTGAVNLRITAITSGNPNLRPQTSKADSFGFTFKPFDELTINLDRWHYTFTDLITTGSANAAVIADPTGALTGKVVRNATGQLSAVFVQYVNAPKVETQGADYEIDWKHDLNKWGMINVNVAGTYVEKYDVTPTAGAVPVRGAGFTNDAGTTVGLTTPVPQWHTNTRATWMLGDSSLTALVRYQSSLIFSRNTQTRISNYYPVDVTYTYNYKGSGSLPDATFTVGSSNIFAQDVPFLPFPGFQPFLASLGDLRGRSVFARLATTF